MSWKLFSGSPAVLPACLKILGQSGPDLQASSKSAGDHSSADSGSSNDKLATCHSSLVTRLATAESASLRTPHALPFGTFLATRHQPLATNSVTRGVAETELRKTETNLRFSAQPETDYTCINHLQRKLTDKIT